MTEWPDQQALAKHFLQDLLLFFVFLLHRFSHIFNHPYISWLWVYRGLNRSNPAIPPSRSIDWFIRRSLIPNPLRLPNRGGSWFAQAWQSERRRSDLHLRSGVKDVLNMWKYKFLFHNQSGNQKACAALPSANRQRRRNLISYLIPWECGIQ